MNKRLTKLVKVVTGEKLSGRMMSLIQDCTELSEINGNFITNAYLIGNQIITEKVELKNTIGKGYYKNVTKTFYDLDGNYIAQTDVKEAH